ncbi:preprotein translocase subunit SecG [Pasteurella multocida]|uniref:preprotein translocase subunit SecG n=1 Tax=Pasteurella multocida TaxID=747 RepID=UPI0020241F81|nr:preprotein translocase subunit SecG [Pasteurella multocida]URJ86916.1 preprotein translocase subunit SecG [Pasteurella multocida]URJ88902.1 preprotein translocase subunit SecG [Pasteurella multocida]
MYNALLFGYSIISVAIIFLILIQQGKGADAGASFGGGASGTIFGSVGSGNFLSKMTALLATVFFVMSIVIGNVNSHRDNGDNVKQGKFDDLSATAEQIQQQQKADVPAVETKNSDIPQ